MSVCKDVNWAKHPSHRQRPTRCSYVYYAEENVLLRRKAFRFLDLCLFLYYIFTMCKAPVIMNIEYKHLRLQSP